MLENRQKQFLGTYALKTKKDFELLAKFILAKKTGDAYYRTPLIRDEDNHGRRN